MLSASELLPSVPALQANEVHQWALLPGVDGGPGYASEAAWLLSAAEAERARRFRFPALTARFISDHAQLRLLLSAYLNTSPQSIEFLENAQGKPRLGRPECGLRFNLSHTQGLTMIAVCLDAEVGIDVELLRPIEDRDAIAALHFSPRENAMLQEQPEHERDAAFLRCWTRKEAYIKARGEGLSLPLDEFTVSLSAGDRATLMHCAWDEQEPRRWMLESLDAMDGYVGALAIERGAWSILNLSWPPGSRIY